MTNLEPAVSTEVDGLSFEFLSSDQIRALSISEIKNVGRAGQESAGKACIYDPCMGSTEIFKLCGSCNEMSNCDGHLGHIDFAIPLYHPLMMSSLCKLLKTVCFYCGRFKFTTKKLGRFQAMFEICNGGAFSEIVALDKLLSIEQKEETAYRHKDLFEKHRNKTIRSILKRVRGRKSAGGAGRSEREFGVWNEVRKRFFAQGAELTECQHCEGTGKVTAKPAADLSHIEVTWSQDELDPNVTKKYSEFVKKSNSIHGEARDGDAEPKIYASVLEAVNEELAPAAQKRLNSTGKGVNTAQLQAFNLWPFVERLFAAYPAMMAHLFPEARTHGHRIFFMECMGVSANRFRPPLVTADKQIVLHARAAALLDIVTSNEFIKLLLQFKFGDGLAAPGGEAEPPKRGKGSLLDYLVKMNYKIDERQLEQFENYLKEYSDLNEAIGNQALQLQKKLSAYMDSPNPRPGIKQTMEHKTGTVRQNMLGKRVNYSARTVIAPDCFIDTNQMGMPLKFALELTVPEYVTKYNVNFLRRLVVNGPRVYPGAKLLRDTNGKVYHLGALSHNERVAKAKLLMLGLGEGAGPKVVYRHILDGDVVLMNRQPTLHKPGIMAHFVKVLTNQKIFRLNYVNCSTYNADFDGDEMNLHLPQDHLSQAEAQLIANADCQFVVPKSGQPIRGLIQDHCQGGALLTSRDTFFTRAEFFNLVHLAVNAFVGAGSAVYLGRQDLCEVEEDVKLDVQLHQLAKRLKMLSDPFARRISRRNVRIQLDEPAILHPRPLYTGKQVVTCVLKTLIDNISRGQGSLEFQKRYRGINLLSRSKTPGDAWGGRYDGDTEEATIVIRHSELLQGVLDKSQFGASSHGLTHLIYELLGPRVCGMLLNSFSYLFTAYLQMRGATCSPRDFLLTPPAEAERLRILRRIKYTGIHLQELFMALSSASKGRIADGRMDLDGAPGAAEPGGAAGRHGALLSELSADLAEFEQKLGMSPKGKPPVHCATFAEFGARLLQVLGGLGSKADAAAKRFVARLAEKCCRVPEVRAALLQYLAKPEADSNMSAVELKYPTWLREEPDADGAPQPSRGGTPAAYRLGDAHGTCSRFYNMVCNSPRENELMATFDRFFQNNIVAVSSDVNELVDRTVVKFPQNGFATMVATGAKGSKVNFAMISCALSQQTLEGKRVPVMPSLRTLPSFAFGDFGARAGGFITDRFLTGLRPQEYFFHCMSGREGLVDTCVKTAKSGYLQRCVLKAMEDVIVCYDETVRNSSGNIIQFKYGEDGVDVTKSAYLTRREDLEANEVHCGGGAAKVKREADEPNEAPTRDPYLERCRCEPGEAVGCIAGQSIGEPATQMTLNTFHLAGHGATNVTLGIPRLVEILQNTSHSSTPFFSAPIRGATEAQIAANAESALNALRKIHLSDVVRAVGVEGNVYTTGKSEKEWEYTATIQLEDLAKFRDAVGEFNTGEVVRLCAHLLLNSFMKRVMGQMIVTMDVNVPFELAERTDQLEEFWNMFVMQKQIVKRDKLSTRIRKMILASGSATKVASTANHEKLINIDVKDEGGKEGDGEEAEPDEREDEDDDQDEDQEDEEEPEDDDSEEDSDRDDEDEESEDSDDEASETESASSRASSKRKRARRKRRAARADSQDDKDDSDDETDKNVPGFAFGNLKIQAINKKGRRYATRSLPVRQGARVRAGDRDGRAQVRVAAGQVPLVGDADAQLPRPAPAAQAGGREQGAQGLARDPPGARRVPDGRRPRRVHAPLRRHQPQAALLAARGHRRLQQGQAERRADGPQELRDRGRALVHRRRAQEGLLGLRHRGQLPPPHADRGLHDAAG